MDAAPARSDDRFGVLLLNMGGPNSLDEIESYLYELFLDPCIVQLPLGRLYRKRLAGFISARRAKKVRVRYEAIGGKSPIGAETEKQAQRLSAILGAPVEFAMRYTRPRVSEAIKSLTEKGAGRLVVVPLYPQYSVSTSASAIGDFRRHTSGKLRYRIVEKHYDHPGYIDSAVYMLKVKLSELEEGGAAHVLFTAHSIPEKYIRRGDPYVGQTEETVRLVYDAAGVDLPYSLAFHSRIGPVRWHGPSLEEELDRVRANGVKRLIVHPISFVSENLETLYDLDVDFRRKCLEAGIEVYIRVPAPGASELYMKALADMVLAAVKEGRWEGAGA